MNESFVIIIIINFIIIYHAIELLLSQSSSKTKSRIENRFEKTIIVDITSQYTHTLSDSNKQKNQNDNDNKERFEIRHGLAFDDALVPFPLGTFV